MWDKLTDLLSRLLPAGLLTDFADWISAQVERRGAGSWGRELLITAIVLILLALAVDTALYWSRRAHREAFLARWERVCAFLRLCGEALTSLSPAVRAREAEAEQAARLQELDEQIQATEDTLQHMEQELSAAAQTPEETPAAEEETFSETIPDLGDKYGEPDAPAEDKASEERFPPEEASPEQPAIAADDSGFAAPRRRRRQERVDP